MSSLLIIFLSSLIAGAAVSAILENRKVKHRSLISAGIFLAVLLYWVIAGQQLPVELSGSGTSSPTAAFSWNLLVDDTAWRMTILMLVLSAGIVLAADVKERESHRETENELSGSRLVPLIFLMAGASALTIWSNTLPTLIQTSTLVILIWSLYYTQTLQNSSHWRKVLVSGCFLALSLAALGLAAAVNNSEAGDLQDIRSWSSASIYWTILASSIFLGMILLHWWRPLKGQLPTVEESLLHLVPAFSGGWLFIKISTQAEIEGTPRLLLTLFCLVGLLIAATMAWSRATQPERLPPYLALAQVNMIVLAAVWVGSEAALAELQLSLLALGGLFLFSARSAVGGLLERIIAFAFVFALAGVPLTIGFGSRLGLYGAWLGGGQWILALAFAFIFTAVIGASLLVVLPRGELTVDRNLRSVEYSTILIILALGVVGLQGIDQFASEIVPLFFILIPAAGGYLLSRKALKVYELEQTIESALHIKIPSKQITDYLAVMLLNIRAVIREGAAIFEGEGGMLWLLIVIVILWLARVSV